MTSTSRALIVAASIGAIEALKDQGFCRWNYTLRSLHQHAKRNIASYTQAKRLSPSPHSSPSITRNIKDQGANLNQSDESLRRKLKQSEESLRKVMYLSCWGPN